MRSSNETIRTVNFDVIAFTSWCFSFGFDGIGFDFIEDAPKCIAFYFIVAAPPKKILGLLAELRHSVIYQFNQ